MRRMLLALVLVALAAACGSEDDPTVAVPSTEGAPTTPCPDDLPAGSAEGLRLSAAPGGQLRPGGKVSWLLRVRNDGADAVTLVFADGRDGDVVLRRGSREVYRWSAARSFTQAVRCRRIDAGADLVLTLEGDVLDLDPGRYEMVATVASRPAPPPATGTVTVQPE